VVVGLRIGGCSERQAFRGLHAQFAVSLLDVHFRPIGGSCGRRGFIFSLPPKPVCSPLPPTGTNDPFAAIVV